MSYFVVVLQTEVLKIRKSKVIWMTMAAFTIAPLMAGFFMVILKDPEFAERSGFIGANAQIAGEANWQSYVALFSQIISVGGIVVFGFITSWIFGREYTDRTAKDLLALPYGRSIIVVAKFTVAFITSFLLSCYIVFVGFLLGWMIGLPGWSQAMTFDHLSTLLFVTLLTILLSTPVAFFACYSGGYLAPLGFVIVVLVLSQIVATTGFGEYFPWSIPALYSGIAGDGHIPGLGSSVIIVFTGIVGFFSALFYWLLADHH